MVHPHQLVLNRHGDANPVPGGPGEGPVMLPDPAAFVRTDPPNEARPTFNERFAPGSTVESVTAIPCEVQSMVRRSQRDVQAAHLQRARRSPLP